MVEVLLSAGIPGMLQCNIVPDTERWMWSLLWENSSDSRAGSEGVCCWCSAQSQDVAQAAVSAHRGVADAPCHTTLLTSCHLLTFFCAHTSVHYDSVSSLQCTLIARPLAFQQSLFPEAFHCSLMKILDKMVLQTQVHPRSRENLCWPGKWTQSAVWIAPTQQYTSVWFEFFSICWKGLCIAVL